MKIKSVDIVGFRAYSNQGDGYFKFTTENNQIANFVSIYAPNGFGKSSFYDGIEWAITNNISRYTRDSLKTINQSTSLYLNNNESGQKILRNRYISDDEPSFVSVQISDGKPFERHVKKARVGGRDYTYDPSSTDKNTKHLVDIFLSQDAIDSFLKEERPELRYDKFMKDFGGIDEVYRQKLVSLHKTCQKEITNLSTKISEQNDLLQEPSFDFSIDQVNQLINGLNLSGENLSNIDGFYSETQDLEFRAIISNRKINLNKCENDLLEKKKKINTSISKIPHTFILKTKIDILEKKLRELNENNDELIEINRLKSNKIDLESKRYSYNIEKNNYLSCLSSINEYTIISNHIFEHNEKLNLIKNELSSIRISLEGNKQESNTILMSKNQLTSDKDKITSTLAVIDEKYSVITSSESIISSLTKDIHDLEKNISASSALINSLNFELNSIEKLEIDYEIIHRDSLKSLHPDESFIQSFSQNISYSKELTHQLTLSEAQAKALDSQSNDIYNLITIATNMLNKTQSDTCPLCGVQHSSHDELIDRILKNDGVSTALQILSKDKNELISKLNNTNEFLDKGINYLVELKNNYINEIKYKINTHSTELQKTQTILSSKNFDLNQKKSLLDNMKSETHFLNKSEYIDKYTLILSELENEIKKTNIEYQKKSSEFNVINEEYKNKNNEISKLETLISEKLKTESYIKIFELVNHNSIQKGEEENFIKSKIYYIDKEDSKLLENIGVLTSTLKSKIDSLSSSNCYIEQQSLTKEIESTYSSLKLSLESYNEIEHLLKELSIDKIESEELLTDSLNSFITSNEEKIDGIKKVILNYDLLENQLSSVLPFLRYWEAQKNILEIKTSIAELDRLDIILIQETRVVESKLLKRIDEFFYTELINSIYSKIDPHPFFKKVKFQCIFPEDEKPRLEVYLYENDGLPISPTLYFSAAQLNILSLSIFLARALHVEHEGSPVKTILIDDPIHSLDSINILSTIDLLRNISHRFDRQIIISTHDENFHELLKLKIPPLKFNSKFIKLVSFGKVMNE
ncbi:hypothetical protein FG473_002927 [Yersinia enterocolitica]|nr:hypothetical protein [Yersinia enterocolitica]